MIGLPIMNTIDIDHSDLWPELIPYEIGYQLKDDEYLIKIETYNRNIPCGFMTKLTKKGEVPASFEGWGKYAHLYYRHPDSPKPHDLNIYIINETFRTGWKIDHWRIGMSQSWVVLIHPFGFTVEIHLKELLPLIKNCTIINGELIGSFKWVPHKLIQDKSNDSE